MSASSQVFMEQTLFSFDGLWIYWKRVVRYWYPIPKDILFTVYSIFISKCKILRGASPDEDGVKFIAVT